MPFTSARKWTSKCHFGRTGPKAAAFAEEKPSVIGNGVRILRSHANCWYSSVEMIETVDVLSECGPGYGIGWEAGSLCRCLQKSQETRAFSINVFQGSDLPPFDYFVGIRLFGERLKPGELGSLLALLNVPIQTWIPTSEGAL
jgi:hypothetical protein